MDRVDIRNYLVVGCSEGQYQLSYFLAVSLAGLYMHKFGLQIRDLNLDDTGFTVWAVLI